MAARNFGALARLFSKSGHCGVIAQPASGAKATWAGHGFSFIEIPNHTGIGKPAARLLFHTTKEQWDFEALGSVANRTFRKPLDPKQPDQFTFAVTYSQSVTAKPSKTVLKNINDPTEVADATMSGAIHAEKGFLIFDPTVTKYGDSDATNNAAPVDGEQYVRLGTIPHGVSIMLSTAVNGASTSTSTKADLKAVFDSFKGTPITVNVGKGTGKYSTQFDPAQTGGIDPSLQLARDLEDAMAKVSGKFVKATTIHMGTSLDDKGLPRQTPNRDAFEAAQTNFLARPPITLAGSSTPPGTVSVPTDVANASVDNVEFWWNFVDLDNKTTIIQYSQAIMLRFGGVIWPHFTGATLIQQQCSSP